MARRFSPDLRKRLLQEVEAWTLALPPGLEILPRDLFPERGGKGFLERAAEQPELAAVGQTLEKGLVPSRQAWRAALLAWWKFRCEEKDSHRAFFSPDREKEVREQLEDLAERIHRVCAEDEKLHRYSTQTLLEELHQKKTSGAETTPEVGAPASVHPVRGARLPGFYLERADYLRRLRRAVLEGGDSPVAVTAPQIGVHGMGGVGKTVLAAALTRDPEIQDRFGDRIHWLALGQEPDPSVLADQLLRMTGMAAPSFRDLGEARRLLRQQFATEPSLLILDDVWSLEHVEIFLFDGAPVHTVVTTRIREIVHGLGAVAVEVDTMGEEQALDLLTRSSRTGSLPPEAVELAKACGYLPLALAMAGALLRDKPQEHWKLLTRTLQEKRLQGVGIQLAGYPYDNLVRVFEVGLEALEPEAMERYQYVAIFPEDVLIPEWVLDLLWGSPESSRWETARWVNLLVDRSLAQRADEEHIALHDLQREALRASLGAGRLRQLHARLIRAFEQRWPTGTVPAEETYYYQWLPWHCQQAGQSEDARALLGSFDWLDTKLRVSGMQELLADFDRFDQYEDLAAIAEALRLSAHVLARDPKQLAGQLLARLRKVERPFVRSLLDEVRPPSPWFNPLEVYLRPPGGAQVRVFSGHTDWIAEIRISGDGRRAVTRCSWNQQTKAWDLEAGEELRSVPRELEALFEDRKAEGALPETLPGGKRGLRIEDGRLEVRELNSGRVLHSIEHPTFERAVQAVVSPDGGLLVTASSSGMLQVWDLEQGALVSTYLDNHLGDGILAMDPRGRFFLSAAGVQLKQWVLEPEAMLRSEPERSWLIRFVSLSADGLRAVAATQGQGLLRWTWKDDRYQPLKPLATLPTYLASLTPDGEKIVLVVTPSLWRADLQSRHFRSGREAKVIEEYRKDKQMPGTIVGGSVTGDGRRVLVAHDASEFGSFGVWDLLSGECLTTKYTEWGTQGIAITPDGRFVLIAGTSPTLWDLQEDTKIKLQERDRKTDRERWEEIREWEDPMGLCAAIATDGGRGVSGSGRSLKLWRFPNQKPETIRAHQDYVLAVAFLPDGDRFLSASRDLTLKLWSFERQENLATFTFDFDPTSLAVAADGTVMVGDQVGQVHFLRLEG